MKLDLATINRDDFDIVPGRAAGLPVFLVRPRPSKHTWTDADRHLRSLLLADDGEILSSGFPKFHNFGEDPERDAVTAAAIAEGAVLFTEKLDGSLIIRDVIGGQVHFRTRGNFDLGEFEPLVIPVIRDRYPRLLDPSLCPAASLLMEFTSPDARVVLRYETADLAHLGYMLKHADRLPELIPVLLYTVAGLPRVRSYPLARDAAEVAAQVRGWRDAEGIVAWCGGSLDALLTKFKSDHYLQIHALKFALSDERLRLFCVRNGIETAGALRDGLQALGLDWEAVQFVLPAFEAHMDGLTLTRLRVRRFLYAAAEAGIFDLADRGAKARALQAMTADGSEWAGLFHVGIMHATGQAAKVDELVYSMALGMTAAQFRHAMTAPADLLAVPAEEAA